MKELVKKISAQFAKAIAPTPEQRARRDAMSHLHSTDRMLELYKVDLIRERGLRASAERQKLFTVKGTYVKATSIWQMSYWKNEVPEIDVVRNNISSLKEKLYGGAAPDSLKDEIRAVDEQTALIVENMRKAWQPLTAQQAAQKPAAK